MDKRLPEMNEEITEILENTFKSKATLWLKRFLFFWESLSKFWLAIGTVALTIVLTLCFNSLFFKILLILEVVVAFAYLLYITYTGAYPKFYFNKLNDGYEYIQPEEDGIKFEDLTVKSPVKELNDLVEYLNNPEEFLKQGYLPERKILLIGDSGSGKETIIKAFANETELPIIRVHASRFFVDENLFDSLFKLAPYADGYILQIDSFEKLNSSTTGNNLSGDLIIDTLLQCLDVYTNVILFATSENPAEIDDDNSEYIISRCFKKVILMPPPSFEERCELIEKFIADFPMDKTVDLKAISKMYIGASIGEIKYLVNIAKSIAHKENRKELTHEDFFNAFDYINTGNLTRKHSKESQKLVAYHEAGHAIVRYVLSGKNAVLRVISTSKGSAGGYTMISLDEENVVTTQQELLDNVCWSYGGRCAERLIFNHLSTGASADIQSATSTILSMIQRYGMSEEIGPINVSPKIALLSVINESPDMRNLISKECSRIGKECEARAMEILVEHRKELDALANYLIEHESITGAEMEELLKKVHDE